MGKTLTPMKLNKENLNKRVREEDAKWNGCSKDYLFYLLQNNLLFTAGTSLPPLLKKFPCESLKEKKQEPKTPGMLTSCRWRKETPYES